jgi:hypothetical protein
MYNTDEIKNVISRGKEKMQLVCVLDYNKHMALSWFAKLRSGDREW